MPANVLQNMRRLGVLGGTFDPIHYGHLQIAEEVRECFSLDMVLFIPTGEPPHKPHGQANAEQRFALARRRCRAFLNLEVVGLDQDDCFHVHPPLRDRIGVGAEGEPAQRRRPQANTSTGWRTDAISASWMPTARRSLHGRPAKGIMPAQMEVSFHG
jgi:cytidyltransferase-like protein